MCEKTIQTSYYFFTESLATKASDILGLKRCIVFYILLNVTCLGTSTSGIGSNDKSYINDTAKSAKAFKVQRITQF